MRLPDYTVTGDGKVTVFPLHGIYGSKEYWLVSGSGHYPWTENPSEFNRAFFGFLDRHFRAA